MMMVATTLIFPVVATIPITIMAIAVNKDSSAGAGTTVKHIHGDIMIYTFLTNPHTRIENSSNTRNKQEPLKKVPITMGHIYDKL